MSQMRFSDLGRGIMAAALAVIAAATGFWAAASAHAQCDIKQRVGLTPTGAACGSTGCRFGYSVAISGDGNTAMVGAYTDSSGIGGVYAFTRSTQQWIQQGPRLTFTGGAGPVQYIGSAIALSADGNTAVIGAYGDATSLGAAYIYVRSGGVWTQQGPKLTPAGGVGAAQFFGISVAISANGNTAIVGAHGDAGYLGAAHVFVRNGTTWSEQGPKLVPLGGVGPVQWFGESVALTADGNGALVGAERDNYDLGAAYWFTRTGTTWTLTGPKILPADPTGTPLYFGAATALNAAGTTAAIGAYADNSSVGAAHVFTRTLTVWTQQGPKLVPTGNAGSGRLGSAISLSATGDVLLAGARADNGFVGAAHVFRRTGGTWSQRGTKLAPATADSGEYGTSVSISADGSRGMVGGPAASSQAGAAYSLGPVCPADWDCDGQQTMNDVFGFINDWLAGLPRADYDNMNRFTPADIFAFLQDWFAQCP